MLFLSSKCIICLVLISNVRSYSRSLGINEISKIGAHLFADVYSLTSLWVFRQSTALKTNHHNVRLYEVNSVAYVHSLLHNMAVKWHYIIVTARACDFFGQRWFWESGTSFAPTQKFQTIIIALRSLFLMLNRRIAASWELSCHTRLRRPHRLSTGCWVYSFI